jgi:hypothetical protein
MDPMMVLSRLELPAENKICSLTTTQIHTRTPNHPLSYLVTIHRIPSLSLMATMTQIRGIYNFLAQTLTNKLTFIDKEALGNDGVPKDPYYPLRMILVTLSW